jgi:hypothetical protein
VPRWLAGVAFHAQTCRLFVEVESHTVKMTLLSGLMLCVASSVCTAQVFPNVPPPDALTFPQKRGAVYDEIRKHQTLGRMLAARDGGFFIYEWQRPYDWAPSTKGISPAAAGRMQTFIYRVETSFDRLKAYVKPTSEPIFYPAPGATYYLGSLSPDEKRLSFYEIDRDDNKVRAAVVELSGEVSPKITWFDLAPDDARLDQVPVWVSASDLIYPIKQPRGGLARADVATGVAKPCQGCEAEVSARAAAPGPAGAATSFPKDGLPDDARLVLQSENGRLSAFTVDTPDVLKLVLRITESSDQLILPLFENQRGPSAPTARR